MQLSKRLLAVASMVTELGIRSRAQNPAIIIFFIIGAALFPYGLKSEINKGLIGAADHEQRSQQQKGCHHSHIRCGHVLLIKQPGFETGHQLLDGPAEYHCQHQQKQNAVIRENPRIPQSLAGNQGSPQSPRAR